MRCSPMLDFLTAGAQYVAFPLDYFQVVAGLALRRLQLMKTIGGLDTKRHELTSGPN